MNVCPKRFSCCWGLLLLLLWSPLAFAGDAPLAGDPFAEDSAPEGLAQGAEASADRQSSNRIWSSFVQKGWLESRNQLRLRDGRAISTRQRLWLEGGYNFRTASTPGGAGARPDITPSLFLSGRLDADMAAASFSDDVNDVSAALQEAYCTVDGQYADFFVGRKMVRWGTGDGINPLDLINPQDHRDPFSSGRSDNRLPVFLGQAAFSLPAVGPFEALSLQAVLVPLAQVTKVPGPGSPWETPSIRHIRQTAAEGRFALEEQDLPSSWFNDGKYMAHLSTTLHGWDLGLAAFSGPRNSPVLASMPDAAGRPVVRPQSPGMAAVGLNFAKGLEQSTLRGELGLKPAYPLQVRGRPDFERSDMLEGVIGLDRTFSLNRYLNLQYYTTHIQDAGKLGQSCWAHGMTYEISDQFLQDDLKLGVSGIVGFSGQGWTLQPYAEYKFGDDWLLAFSIMLFGGNGSGAYGQYGDSDFATLRIRRTF